MDNPSPRRPVPRAAALSIRIKLFVLVSGVVTGLVTFLAIYFASRQVELLERTVVERGDFIAQQLRTAVAFADKETAREVFEAAHNQREVLHLALFDADGHLVFADGNGSLTAPAPATHARLETGAGRLRVVAPVVSVEGPRGTLVVELDKTRLDAETRSARVGAAGIGFGGLAIGCLAALLLGRAFTRRIERVRHAAAAVADGDLGQTSIDGGPNDEIGQLITAFNAMVESLRLLVSKLSETSAQLEGASDSFLDIVRSQGEDMQVTVQQVETALRGGATAAARGDTLAHIERLVEGTRGLGAGLVPGFVELRQYAEDLNQVIVKFKVSNGVPATGAAVH